MDGDQPRVRGMLLFRADENGFVFHTASTKDVFRQIMANPKAEMCFSCGNVQIRVTGVLELDENPALREEIFAHPTRKFTSGMESKRHRRTYAGICNEELYSRYVDYGNKL